VALLSKIAG